MPLAIRPLSSCSRSLTAGFVSGLSASRGDSLLVSCGLACSVGALSDFASDSLETLSVFASDYLEALSISVFVVSSLFSWPAVAFSSSKSMTSTISLFFIVEICLIPLAFAISFNAVNDKDSYFSRIVIPPFKPSQPKISLFLTLFYHYLLLTDCKNKNYPGFLSETTIDSN